MVLRKRILLLLCICLPLQVIAQEFSEQSLKTLFTSMQERQAIDSGRRANKSSDGQSLVEPSSVQINGIVKRSNGKSVVWANGKNTMDSSIVDGVKLYPGSISVNNKVPVMIDGKKVYIKPGETWTQDTGGSGAGD